VAGGMNWRNHTWLRNPFNRPPYQGPPNIQIPPPDPLACPNPTGSTGVAGQIWGAQGDYPVFSCPSQPYSHFNNGQGTVFVAFLYGVPTIDFPRGNPFSNPVIGLPQCVETNSLVSGTACNLPVTTYSPGSYVLGRSDYVAVLGTFIDGSHTDARFHPPLAKKYHSLFNYGEKASLSRVPDGSSNTLVFSEFCGVYGTGNNSQPQLNGWLSASWTTNAVSVSLGTCPDPKNNNCGFESDPKGSGAALGGWHGGLFQVVFADGSVRALRLGLEQSLLYSLAGYKDGDDVSNSDY
jgi:prepilin-type processing-associated H-X9-DG protein